MKSELSLFQDDENVLRRSVELTPQKRPFGCNALSDVMSQNWTHLGALSARRVEIMSPDFASFLWALLLLIERLSRRTAGRS
jgi:hypothetical protein